jgi:hypothetical protein
MSMTCPRCHKDDAMQRISAAVKTGTANGTLSGSTSGVVHMGGEWGVMGGFTTLRGHTTSQLAQMLAAPPKPSLDVWQSELGIVVIVLFALVIGLFASAGLVNLLRGPSSGDLGSFDGLMQALGCVVVPCLGAVLCLIMVGYLAFRDIPKKQEEHAAEEAARDGAMDRWERLYYCLRDDVVFDQETREYCRPELHQQLLYAS